ncbi:MAG: SDR family NAD(P)-dependent oxidoreductase [Mucilaginibacter sp.]
MKELVLLTGASTGIGYEMAGELAARKHDLILVARNTEKLESLKAELTATYGIRVQVFACDLSETAAAVRLYEAVKAAGLRVTMLINNAGKGLYGKFVDIPLPAELEMISLNISALITLTKLFGHDMKEAGYGRIMHVASLLSFLPFPYYSVYSATKAFVLAFSETIAAELEAHGVTVTTLCPGPVNTPFNTPAMLHTNAYRVNKPIEPRIVAKAGINHLLTGRGVKVVGLNNWLLAKLSGITPARLMLRIKTKLASPYQKN